MGLIASVTGMFSYATRYEGRLSKFYENTAQDWSILTGLLAGVTVSTLVTIVVSIVTRRKVSTKQFLPNGSIQTETVSFPNTDDVDILEWQKTMSIDNPLNPYRVLYTKEIEKSNIGSVLTSKHMEAIFTTARRISWLSAGIGALVFLGIVPITALTQDILSLRELDIWISACQYWCLLGTFFVVLVPPIQEGFQIYRQFRKNKTVTTEDME